MTNQNSKRINSKFIAKRYLNFDFFILHFDLITILVHYFPACVFKYAPLNRVSEKFLIALHPDHPTITIEVGAIAIIAYAPRVIQMVGHIISAGRIVNLR